MLNNRNKQRIFRGNGNGDVDVFLLDDFVSRPHTVHLRELFESLRRRFYKESEKR